MSEIVDICQKVRGQLRTIGLSASGIRAPGQQQAFEVCEFVIIFFRKENQFFVFLILVT